MNDLKTEKKEEVEKYIAAQLARLFFAYNQNNDIESLNLLLNFIVSELSQLYSIDKYILDETYNELLRNYTIYRKINGASYITAFYKAKRK